MQVRVFSPTFANLMLNIVIFQRKRKLSGERDFEFPFVDTSSDVREMIEASLSCLLMDSQIFLRLLSLTLNTSAKYVCVIEQQFLTNTQMRHSEVYLMNSQMIMCHPRWILIIELSFQGKECPTDLNHYVSSGFSSLLNNKDDLVFYPSFMSHLYQCDNLFLIMHYNFQFLYVKKFITTQ